MIHTRSGAAANRRGSASGARQTLSCLLEDPLPGPCDVKERSQLPAMDLKAGLLPTARITQETYRGDPFSGFLPFHNLRILCFQKIVSKTTQLVSCFLIPHLRLQ